MTRTARDFDIIIYGASGFTGRLVAEYLSQRGIKRWAMGGRSLEKLAAVRDEIGAPADTPLIAADSDDAIALEAMCARTHIVVTTVGPYQLYGTKLVAACAATGTDYADLCGEPAWMHEMIAAHDAKARETGARILFSCGFDSIPFDLGVWFLQQEAERRHGKPAPRVRGRVRAMQGSFSGGTAASLKATLAAAAKNPSIIGVLKNPFALTPGFEGPSQPSGLIPEVDADSGRWAAPFIMAPINTKNVHRTNFLLGHPYGTDFVYDEMMLTTLGDMGKAAAEAIARANPFSDSKTPQPGEGPSKEEREAGFYEIAIAGEYADGSRLRAVVKGDKDPGYGSTSKMIAETALALLDSPAPGGISTPTAVLARPLLERLEAHAGLSFAIEA